MGEDGLPSGAGIGRVALRVGDLDAVATFYEEVVGLRRLADADGPAAAVGAPAAAEERATADAAEFVVLGAGDEPLLSLVSAPDAPPRDERAAGLYHTAFRVPDREALGAAVERVRDAGRLDGAADHLVSEAIYLTDPEDNGVELYVDRPRSEWEYREDGVRIDTLPLDVEELAALSDGGDRAPPGTDVGHVHLEVTALSASRRFYVDALGTNVRDTVGEDALFVAAGDYHHHVGLNTWGQRTRPAGDGRGLAWFEVTVPGPGALTAVVERFDRLDVEYEREDGTVVVSDPDAIELRLSVDGAAE